MTLGRLEPLSILVNKSDHAYRYSECTACQAGNPVESVFGWRIQKLEPLHTKVPLVFILGNRHLDVFGEKSLLPGGLLTAYFEGQCRQTARRRTKCREYIGPNALSGESFEGSAQEGTHGCPTHGARDPLSRTLCV